MVHEEHLANSLIFGQNTRLIQSGSAHFQKPVSKSRVTLCHIKQCVLVCVCDCVLAQVFVCLWKGCKVYNTPSTSQSWLQRHMLTHSGDKPFKVSTHTITPISSFPIELFYTLPNVLF